MKIEKSHLKKCTHQDIDEEFLQSRANLSIVRGYEKQKWVLFCEYFLKRGYVLNLYEARQTVSKYIKVTHPSCQGKSYLVRFSNHKPNKRREKNNDCDFFVGKTHLGIKTAKDAAIAVRIYFEDLGAKGEVNEAKNT